MDLSLKLIEINHWTLEEVDKTEFFSYLKLLAYSAKRKEGSTGVKVVDAYIDDVWR